jgi:hypothetical protein
MSIESELCESLLQHAAAEEDAALQILALTVLHRDPVGAIAAGPRRLQNAPRDAAACPADTKVGKL